MLPTEGMQHTVNHQACKLFAHAHAMLARICRRNRRSDEDVSHDDALALTRMLERDDVGGACVPDVRAMKARHVSVVDERDGDQCRPYAFRGKRKLCELAHARFRERNPNVDARHLHLSPQGSVLPAYRASRRRRVVGSHVVSYRGLPRTP